MVKLDFDRYIEYLDIISDALAETLGEIAASEVLTQNFGEAPSKDLDEKVRRKVSGIYKNGM